MGRLFNGGAKIRHEGCIRIPVLEDNAKASIVIQLSSSHTKYSVRPFGLKRLLLQANL